MKERTSSRAVVLLALLTACSGAAATDAGSPASSPPSPSPTQAPTPTPTASVDGLSEPEVDANWCDHSALVSGFLGHVDSVFTLPKSFSKLFGQAAILVQADSSDYSDLDLSDRAAALHRLAVALGDTYQALDKQDLDAARHAILRVQAHLFQAEATGLDVVCLT